MCDTKLEDVTNGVYASFENRCRRIGKTAVRQSEGVMHEEYATFYNALLSHWEDRS